MSSRWTRPPSRTFSRRGRLPESERRGRWPQSRSPRLQGVGGHAGRFVDGRRRSSSYKRRKPRPRPARAPDPLQPAPPPPGSRRRPCPPRSGRRPLTRTAPWSRGTSPEPATGPAPRPPRRPVGDRPPRPEGARCASFREGLVDFLCRLEAFARLLSDEALGDACQNRVAARVEGGHERGLGFQHLLPELGRGSALNGGARREARRG